eukprot:2793212-Prorocentrum_lima.AAC.1
MGCRSSCWAHFCAMASLLAAFLHGGVGCTPSGAVRPTRFHLLGAAFPFDLQGRGCLLPLW